MKNNINNMSGIFDVQHYDLFFAICNLPCEFSLLVFVPLLICYGLLSLKKEEESLVNETFAKLCFIILCNLCVILYTVPRYKMTFLGDQFINDFFVGFNKYFLIILCMIFVILAYYYLESHKIHRFEFYVLFLISLLGFFFMLSSFDFLILYISLEVQSFSFYLLVAFRRNISMCLEASLKYFILGAISSGLFLFGILLIYGYTGSINFMALHYLLKSNDVSVFLDASHVFIGFIFIFCSLCFKLSIAPFHIWSPDVYQGAPLIVAFYFAVVSKIAVFGVFLRLIFFVFFDMLKYYPLANYFMDIFIIICLIIGVFNALLQSRLRKFFAYSSVTHMGFILMGVSSLNLFGLTASLFYIYFYILMNLVAWTFLLVFRHPGDGLHYGNLAMLKGLRQKNEAMAFALCYALYSMSGIPPFAGFLVKFLTLVASLFSGHHVVVFFAIGCSLISAYYYTRLIKLTFFEKIPHEKLEVLEPNRVQSFILQSGALLLFLVYGLWSPIYDVMELLALSLMN